MLRILPTSTGRASGVLFLLLSLVAPHRSTRAADARLELRARESGLHVSFRGDADDDWHLEGSTDLLTWTTVAPFGVLRSGGATNSPSRALPEGAMEPFRFFRARRTAGLYDPSLLRTVSLTFTQANWQSLLTANYSRGSNITAAMVSLDNASTNHNVGVRYKGNTSYQNGGAKKSINIELDWTDPDGDLMGYKTLNLNNAAGDETILREPLFFNVLQTFAPGPRASLARLFINGAYWGVYSFAQQENSDLIKEWFPSSDGDRWRAPNIGGGGGAPGGGGFPPGGGGFPPGGGGGFASAASALSYLGASVSSYTNNYLLKTDNSTNAWPRLVHAITVLNNTPSTHLAEEVQNVLAVDSWLWFLAAENVFADDDSYFNKGADYGFYFEPESGRFFPIEHDGNESFTAGDVSLSPVQGSTGTNRPVLKQLLSVPHFRQRYLAHMRTILDEHFNPTAMNRAIDAYSALSLEAITADTKKSYSMAAYTSDLAALRNFVRNRHAYLTNHAELTPRPPALSDLAAPAPPPDAASSAFVTVRVQPTGTNGVDSVWLHHRVKAYGRFDVTAMADDGQHGDGGAGDGIWGALVPAHPAGTKVRFYAEARSANAAKAAAFLPAHAEVETLSYRVALTTAKDSPVVLNEILADNVAAVSDPQGHYDDWIELRNLTDREMDLTGYHLTDEPSNPRKWRFPDGTRIAPNGYLVVWADEDGQDSPGLHANFKLAASGEQVYLTDTDARLNAVLDSVTFGTQSPDVAWGRSMADADLWAPLAPTPGTTNP